MQGKEKMFTTDYKKLTFYLSEFYDIDSKKMPEYDEFCLLELKDGRLTAGKWYPKNWQDKKCTEGEFLGGKGESVEVGEVSKWHSLDAYNLSELLQDDMTMITSVSTGYRSRRQLQA